MSALESAFSHLGPVEQPTPVSPYIFCAGAGVLFLLASWLLGYFGFGKQPGLGHDSVGHRAANLAHDLLFLARPLAVALLVCGLVGFAGSLREEQGPRNLLTALLAGMCAFIVSYLLPTALAGLNAQASQAHPEVGALCLILQDIPGRLDGFGKVRIRQGGKKGDFLAQTAGDTLSAGFRAVVVAVLDDLQLEVAAESAVLPIHPPTGAGQGNPAPEVLAQK
jgi:hypothetical protein